MYEDYDEKLLGAGNICSIVILAQDGPICGEICEVTLKLLNIAERCWSAESMATLANKWPTGTSSKGMMGAMVGSGLHGQFYDLAKQAKESHWLPANLNITRPATREADPSITKSALKSAKGPDFVLNGRIGNKDGHSSLGLDNKHPACEPF